jgi:hypothetical protein
MTFSAFDRFVAEVISVATGRELLSGRPPESHSWFVVQSLTEAVRFAKDIEIGENEWLWRDLRAHQMRSVYAECQKFDLNEFNRFVDVLHDILNKVARSLGKRNDRLPEIVVNDATSDLFCCALNRAVNQKQGFFEDLFSAYSAGGWPCGWKGAFPQGQICVYFPTPFKA